jgi:hypothetical protein
MASVREAREEGLVMVAARAAEEGASDGLGFREGEGWRRRVVARVGTISLIPCRTVRQVLGEASHA